MVVQESCTRVQRVPIETPVARFVSAVPRKPKGPVRSLVTECLWTILFLLGTDGHPYPDAVRYKVSNMSGVYPAKALNIRARLAEGDLFSKTL